MIDWKLWNVMIPFRQLKIIPVNLFEKLKKSQDIYLQLFSNEFVKHTKNYFNNKMLKKNILESLSLFPTFEYECIKYPINFNLLSIEIFLKFTFRWQSKIHSLKEYFWILISDVDGEEILYYDLIAIDQWNVYCKKVLNILIYLRIKKNPVIFLELLSDRWLRSEYSIAINLDTLHFPLRNNQTFLKQSIQTDHSVKNSNHNNIHFHSSYITYNQIEKALANYIFQKELNYIFNIYPGYDKHIVLNLCIYYLFNKTYNLKNSFTLFYLNSAGLKSDKLIKSLESKFGFGELINPGSGLSLSQNQTDLFNKFYCFNLIILELNLCSTFNKFVTHTSMLFSYNLIVVDDTVFKNLYSRAITELFLNRMIQKYIEDLIVENLVSDKIKQGDKLLIDHKPEDDHLTLLINKKEIAS